MNLLLRRERLQKQIKEKAPIVPRAAKYCFWRRQKMEAKNNRFPLSYLALSVSERQFRIAHIHPGTIDEMLMCNIETVSLKHKPSYEALSYEWGDSGSNTSRIKINGTLVSIRDNLWWAIYHLRQTKGVRTIWIDALCINQNDERERNHQVAQMKDIYSQAVRVVAWIGQSQIRERALNPETSELAIAFLYELSTGLVKDYPYSRRDVRRVIFTPHKIRWDALGMLCRRRYWSRLWIIQEVVLASDLLVQCGNSIVPWQVFSKVWSQLRQPAYQARQQYIHTIITSIPFILDTRRVERVKFLEIDCPDRESSLVDLLIQFNRSSCHDIRDRIFGLYSLSPDCCRKALEVDYSMGLVSICARLLEHHLIKHGGPDGKATLATTLQVLRALGLEIHSADEMNSLRTAFMSLKSVRNSANVPMETINCGEIICLRSVAERYLTPSGQERLLNVDSKYPPGKSFSVLSLLSLDAQKSLTNVDRQTCYLNPNSDHRCNRITSSKKCSEKFKATQTSDALLVKHYGNSTISNKGIKSNDPGVIALQEGQEPAIGRRSRKADSESSGAKAAEAITEQDFWNYLSSQQANLWFSSFSDQKNELKNRTLRWRELDLMLFLTSTGVTGTVTRNAKLGDRVHKLSGSDRRLAILSADSSLTHVTAKGLELQPDYYPKSFSYREPGLVIEASEKKLEIDVATLLYLCGYF